MKLGRRGFLGAILGGAVAAPGMVKDAAASMSLDGLRLPNAGLASMGYLNAESVGGSSGPGPYVEGKWELEELRNLIGLTRDAHRERIASLMPNSLDPDIAEMRSLSMGAKIRMQRERTYWRDFNNRKSWLMSVVEKAGLSWLA